MEKKRTNLIYVFLGVLIILFGLAAYKSLEKHHEKEYQVLNSRILESAKDCYLKEDCTGEITIKDLYNKKYLDKQIDPVTKEDVDETICIKFENNEAKYCK